MPDPIVDIHVEGVANELPMLREQIADARAEIERLKADIADIEAWKLSGGNDATLAEAVGLLRDCKLRLRLVIENDSTMKYFCQPLIDGITTVLARLVELGLDK